MAEMNINNTEFDASILNEDPVFKRVNELTIEEHKKIDPLVESIITDFQNLLENNEYTIHELFHSLGMCIVYLTQGLFNNHEEFGKAYEKSSSIVTNNILPSLGLYVATKEDEELNKNGIVTYNGSYDEDNFLLRNMLLDAGAMIDVMYWRIKTATAMKELNEKESEEKDVE